MESKVEMKIMEVWRSGPTTAWGVLTEKNALCDLFRDKETAEKAAKLLFGRLHVRPVTVTVTVTPKEEGK